MAMEILERALHDLCVSIQVDDVRKRQFKRYMDLSRSINSLQFNKEVVLKKAEEGSPDYGAFAKCIDKRKIGNNFDSEGRPLISTPYQNPNDPCQSGSQRTVGAQSPLSPSPANASKGPCTRTNPCLSPSPPNTSRGPCTITDPCLSPCPTPSSPCGEDENPEPDACEMIDLIGETTPIILMDLLAHHPEMLARVMAKSDDDCGININAGSSECLPNDEECLNEENGKAAKVAAVKDALCSIKNAEVLLTDYFEHLADSKNKMSDGTYIEGTGEDRRRNMGNSSSNQCNRNL